MKSKFAEKGTSKTPIEIADAYMEFMKMLAVDKAAFKKAVEDPNDNQDWIHAELKKCGFDIPKSSNVSFDGNAVNMRIIFTKKSTGEQIFAVEQGMLASVFSTDPNKEPQVIPLPNGDSYCLDLDNLDDYSVFLIFPMTYITAFEVHFNSGEEIILSSC